MRKNGFTLIELLVVIAIIALLLSILIPTLRGAKEIAIRIVCASRLRQWGTAIQMYTADNGQELMRMGQYWGGNPYPHYINIRYAEQGRKALWSIEGINPYINAFSDTFVTDGLANDMVTCVNCSDDFMMDWIKEVNWADRHSFVETAYSYFAGADLVHENRISSNAKKVLVTDELRSDRLLMAEILNLDTSDGAYRYNHGKSGWSWNESYRVNPPPGHKVNSPNAEATGRSQLFGDGHIEWRKIDSDNNIPITADRFKEEWNGPGSGWMASNDTSFF